MLLAEIARAEEIFSWIAGAALRLAGSSAERLFALVFGVCVVVTIFLSNDATAVVLTPAVATIAARARVAPGPYVLACAFVANAASFVLPISNPANLVIYGDHLPALAPWFMEFALPSLASVGATYLLLRAASHRELRDARVSGTGETTVTLRRRALFALIASVTVMVAASLFGLPLGRFTAGAALAALAITLSGRNGATARAVLRIDYPILALVAVLFIAVGAIDRSGALGELRRLLAACFALGSPLGEVAAAFSLAALANLINNLPVGLLARFALDGLHQHAAFVQAVVAGIDLGPNLSISGSLATLLWLSALRREGVQIGFWSFLRMGAIVMPAALLLTILALARH